MSPVNIIEEPEHTLLRQQLVPGVTRELSNLDLRNKSLRRPLQSGQFTSAGRIGCPPNLELPILSVASSNLAL